MTEQKIAPTTAGSQLRVLPGSSWEHIFESGAREPSLNEGLRDAELFDEYIAPFSAIVDEKKSARVESRIARKESVCSRRGEPVFWSLTEKNRKRIPLNPTPSSDPRRGNFVAVNLPSGEHLLRYVTDAKRAEIIASGGVVWETHLASCPARRLRR